MTPIAGPQILLANGAYFDFDRLNVEVVTIEVVAHALSRITRFTGHTPRFYSVAEHCVHTSHLVPPAHALTALLHDAAEALLGDVASPLKSILPAYRALGTRVEAALIPHLGGVYPLPPVVKGADLALLAAEKRAFFPRSGPWTCLADVPAVPVNIRCWEPWTARIEFLSRYHALAEAGMIMPPPSPVDRLLMAGILITIMALLVGGGIATMRAEAPHTQEAR